jgi:hypothetical protein
MCLFVCLFGCIWWPHSNPPKPQGPFFAFGIAETPLMNQSVSLSIIGSFETNGVKVIQFKVIFISENELILIFFSYHNWVW